MVEKYPLLQKPFIINTENVNGKMEIFGNTKNNEIQFIVEFPSIEQIIPLIITISSKGKEYKTLLMIRDIERFSIRSNFSVANYLLRDGFCITNISPLANFNLGV